MNPALRRWLPAPGLRTIVLFAIAAVASLLFVVIADEVREGAADHFDEVTAMTVHRLDSALGDAIAKTATFIGSNFVVGPVVILTAALAIYRRERRPAAILALDVAVVMIANGVLKVYFSRQRPTLFDKIPLPKSFSFPSGHAMAAMGIYGVVAAILVALYPRARTAILIVGPVLIFMIGVSRIYLGVHWPLDVLAGFAGGVPPMVVAIYLLHRPANAPETISRPL